MYEIKASSTNAMVLEASKNGVRILRPNDDESLLELDAFLGTLQGSLDHEGGANVFLRSFNELLTHLRNNASQKTVDVTVTTTSEGDKLIHRFHLSSR